MSRRPSSERVRVEEIVPIVGDALLAGPIAEGVSIPVIILDTSRHPDVAEVIRVHRFLPPGDVTFNWGGIEGDPDGILLVLDFTRPIETRAALKFSILSQGILVDAALSARAVYLQSEVEGDSVSERVDRPKLVIELPETGFRAKWNDLFVRGIAAGIRDETNVSRKESEDLARQIIGNLRRITEFRMPSRPPPTPS